MNGVKGRPSNLCGSDVSRVFRVEVFFFKKNGGGGRGGEFV